MNETQNVWANGDVCIPLSTLDEIKMHACESYSSGLILNGMPEGEEACGVITGPLSDPSLANQAIRWPNLANRYHRLNPQEYTRTGRTYFWIDPFRFEREYYEAQQRQQPFKVLYHSHLDCGAYFSETDASMALAGMKQPAYDVAYLVVSVRGNQ